MYKIKPESVLRITVPWPPTINHYWGEKWTNGRVQRFIGPKGVAFRAAVKELVEPHLEHCKQHFNIGNRLAVCAHIRPPDRRRRDIDNLCKAMLDALEHAGAYPDDEQIDSLTLLRDKDDLVKGGEVKLILGSCDI